MTSGTPWLIAFAALVVVSAATVFLRKEPSLVRGSTVFLFTLLYVALAWSFLAWRTGGIPARMLAAGIIALALAGLMAPWWFVFGGPGTAVAGIIEVCFGRVCAQYRRVDAGYVMTVPGGDFHVRLHAAPVRSLTLLSFREAPAHRKGHLFRQLLRKQYRGALPTVRIRIG